MKPLPKAYEPKKYEDKIYQKWEKSGLFNPDNLKLSENAKPFSVMMPPPNVTGVLHLGHALENSLMDIEVRYQRMRGKRTLLVPGTDHAAVATQAKVENELIKQGIKNPREKYGRKELIKLVREYAEISKKTIIGQIKKMGTSCDWSRLVYTFDEKRNKAVNEIFVRMFNDGLIYRGYRVVNWTLKGQSTLSDDEIVHVEQKAKLYTFKYSKDFPIPISTTRPETKLGDTAVAVNLKDKRYKKYIGKTFIADVGARNPLKIKVVADKEIDSQFGTGAVGVTPAHSHIDFEIAQRHNLPMIQVIGNDGLMTEEAGKYRGLSIVEARTKFVSHLKKEKLLLAEEEIINNVGTSDRYGDIIEVLPMEQWFIDVNKTIPKKNKTLKQLMRDAIAIKGGSKVSITPKRFEKQYFRWIDNLRDWCISRQIWWGHQIPVWYKSGKMHVGKKPPTGSGWKRDPDTLDTWFSSGLWTFSSFGWPEKTDDLKTFHPTSWMQMGYEILFFWMARMILMSCYALDQVPFKDVYIHGILRDKDGRKFSKSLGNGIDPIEVCNKYGTDALRLSLILGISPGNDSRFFEEKVEGNRNLINKLWNIARFIISSSKPTGKKAESKKPDTKNSSLADKWILGKLNTLIKEVSTDLENYQFSAAGEKLRDFTWNDFADWYVEISKIEKNKDELLFYVLDNLLRLWHPFIPFVTEKIYEEIHPGKILMVEKWPRAEKWPTDKKTEKQFEHLQELIAKIRNLRNSYKIEPAVRISAYARSVKHKEIIEKLSRINISMMQTNKKMIEISSGDLKIGLDIAGIIDVEKEKKRLESEIENLKNLVSKTKTLLANKNFLKSAPKEVIERNKNNLNEYKNKLKTQLELLNNLK